MRISVPPGASRVASLLVVIAAAGALIGGELGCRAADSPTAIAMPSDYHRRQMLPELEVRPAVSAADRDVEATVVVQYDLTEEGRVADARVLYSLPRGRFDHRALNDLNQWQIKPVPTRRHRRKIRLFYQSESGGPQLLGLRPGRGDCDAQSWIHTETATRRWVLVSCSDAVVGRIDMQGLVGWRSVRSQHRQLVR